MSEHENPHPWDGKGRRHLPHVSLDDAVAHMEDGDLLLWHGNYGISKFFEWAARSWMSHAALVSGWDGSPMLLQAEFPKIEAVPLWKTVKRYPGDVYWYKLAPAYRKEVDVAEVLRRARGYLGLEFSVNDVFRDLMHRRFEWKLPKDRKHAKAMFCSEFVARSFRDAHAPPIAPKHDEALDTLPGDIAKSPNVVFQAILHEV